MTQPHLLFSGITPASRHASYLGADEAEGRAPNQAEKYLKLLKAHADRGLTDFEAASLMKLERTSVIARRVPLVKAGQVIASGFRAGPTGIKNVVWCAR